MARLVLINGAPGSGKSTLARRYVDDHPLALALDIDVVRGLLGRWLDQPLEAGRLARRLAVAMARAHLGDGRSVVVPQFLGRLEFVVELQQVAEEAGAEFVEVVLLSSAEESATRFTSRSSRPQTDAHRDAAVLLERLGGTDALPGMYADLLAVVASRPRTRVVITVDGRTEETYAALLAALESDR